MTDTLPRQTRTRPTDEIEPMVPVLPRDPYRPDGGARRRRRRERPPATDYADPSTRDREEIEPLVPDLG
ncbi:MAG: hypothetical protein ABEJ23_04685 [Haloarculaceae archaeon]